MRMTLIIVCLVEVSQYTLMMGATGAKVEVKEGAIMSPCKMDVHDGLSREEDKQSPPEHGHGSPLRSTAHS